MRSGICGPAGSRWSADARPHLQGWLLQWKQQDICGRLWRSRAGGLVLRCGFGCVTTGRSTCTGTESTSPRKVLRCLRGRPSQVLQASEAVPSAGKGRLGEASAHLRAAVATSNLERMLAASALTLTTPERDGAGLLSPLAPCPRASPKRTEQASDAGRVRTGCTEPPGRFDGAAPSCARRMSYTDPPATFRRHVSAPLIPRDQICDCFKCTQLCD